MKKALTVLSVLLLIGVVSLGCKKKQEPTPPKPNTENATKTVEKATEQAKDTAKEVTEEAAKVGEEAKKTGEEATK